MPRYSVSREKFPHQIDLGLTDEQYQHAAEIAAFIGAFRKGRKPVLSVGIRYALDFCYVSLLSQGSINQTAEKGQADE